MKRFLFMMLALVIAVCAANLYSTEQKLEALEQNVIRLHIRANSDSLTDQTAKLRLRDAILPYAQEWLAGCDTQSERIAAMQQRLPEIRSLAESVLKEAGCSSSVSAEFSETAFPERTYGRYTLPAGNYQSLILTVGAGEGQNWWCLMYPALCIPASAYGRAGSLPEDAEDLACAPQEYEIRLKCVDLFRSIGRWMREKYEAAEKSGFFSFFQRAFGCLSRSSHIPALY